MLVVGATGGVGAIAVQYAAMVGATVLATGRPGAEQNLLRDLGAHTWWTTPATSPPRSG